MERKFDKIIKVKIGDNLRGKTITFSSMCGVPTAFLGYFGIVTNDNMCNGYSFIFGNGDFYVGYSGETIKYFEYPLTSYYINSYTFPNDRDIIVLDVIDGIDFSDINYGKLECVRIGII